MSEQDIRRLLTRYCALVDTADWDAVGVLFAHADLADSDGNVFARGAAEVAAYFRENIVLHEGSPRTKHLVLNTVVDEMSDDVIVASSSYLVLQALDDLPLQPIVTGRYRDTFRRNAGGDWRFEERRYTIDLAGDLSRHLRATPPSG